MTPDFDSVPILIGCSIPKGNTITLTSMFPNGYALIFDWV
jgi:hypothetical protein